MVTVHLHNVVLFAYHGIYEHETKQGNTFEIDLDVTYDEASSDFSKIDEVINYENLFVIVQQRMAIATPLLEKVCDDIIQFIKEKYSSVKEISITLYKLQAPIKDFKGKVGVTLSRKFE
ncbi:MAG: dihydroneopterin aldolase [Bacteroidetes bacterium]|nr:dihydroneopterin aldolase [Bacteroidota bacterium]MBS1933566.1 dihydroneopterin aldolase [Bacteroidota bacterium]